MSALSRRKTGDGTATRARTPLFRRFQYRYAFVIGAFGLLVIVHYVLIMSTLERVDQRSKQLQAAGEEINRVYAIHTLANEIDAANGSGDAPLKGGSLRVESVNLRAVKNGLVKGDASLKLPYVAPTTELQDLFGGSSTLDATLENLALAGEQIASATGRDQSRADQLSVINARSDDAIRSLKQVAQAYGKDLDTAIQQQRQAQTMLLIIDIIAAAFAVAVLFQPMARKIRNETYALEEAEKVHRENNERQTFRNELQQALEVTDNEEEVLAAVGRAVEQVIPENKAELLVSDSSEAHLRKAQVSPLHGGPNCPVESPWGCAAIRRGQSMVYESSRMLNVCPKLPEHDGGAHSAVCVPVTFMGRSLGVLHTTGTDGHPPTHTQIERLSVLASEIGSRLGNLRATQATELQAKTDGLTGLLNRRSLESRARTLVAGQDEFSIAIADLDHFKDLNDTYGHEAGDRALRIFAKVLRDNLRPDDVPARYGGEEFVVLLPGTNVLEARQALERLQEALAAELQRAGTIVYTASWGLTDRTAGANFDELVAVADAALYAAKRAGRNCIMVDGAAAEKFGALEGVALWDEVDPGNGSDGGGDGAATGAGGNGEQVRGPSTIQPARAQPAAPDPSGSLPIDPFATNAPGS